MKKCLFPTQGNSKQSVMNQLQWVFGMFSFSSNVPSKVVELGSHGTTTIILDGALLEDK